MTTAQISGVTPPPSVDDILGVLTEEATRIGQVDFTTRLAPEPVVQELAAAAPAGRLHIGAAPSLADLLPDAVLVLADDDEDELDEDAPEAVEVRREPVAVAAPPERPEVPEPRPVARPRRRLGWRAQPVEAPAQGSDDARPADTPQRPQRLAVPDLPVEEREDAPVALLRHPAAATTPPGGQGRPSPLPDVAPAPQSLRLVDERPPTVEELARLVVERLHDAELAMMRHLEATQAEADRRVELATAQAELDADLIRLNARREAHAIVAAARRRSGQPVDQPAERAVSEVTEALGRFADVMEELRPPRYRTMP